MPLQYGICIHLIALINWKLFNDKLLDEFVAIARMPPKSMVQVIRLLLGAVEVVFITHQIEVFYNLPTRLVGIMLQISFIILFLKSLNFIPFMLLLLSLPYLQFKLLIKVSYLSYLTLVEPLESIHFTFINAFIVCPDPEWKKISMLSYKLVHDVCMPYIATWLST